MRRALAALFLAAILLATSAKPAIRLDQIGSTVDDLPLDWAPLLGRTIAATGLRAPATVTVAPCPAAPT